MAAPRLLRFVTSLQHVECKVSTVKPLSQAVYFQQGATRSTVSAEAAFQAPGKHAFEVHMRLKKVKTAVGFLSENKTTEYMRDSPIGETHVSMGGAGWIHPKEIAANQKYGEGDKVKVEVDFDQSVVRFYVNGACVGQDEWLPRVAFPAISADGGPCELDITFD